MRYGTGIRSSEIAKIVLIKQGLGEKVAEGFNVI
jgi:hypothetical protein